MDAEGAVGLSDWIKLALLCGSWVFAFWMGREYQKEKDRDG